MAPANYPSLKSLITAMAALGADRIVAKPLSENDNTKQQIYLGGNFESLNVIPYGSVVEDSAPKTPNLKATIALQWMTSDGRAEPAPHAKLILYPDYPEVRLSGFIRGCASAPSAMLQPIPRDQRHPDSGPDGRVLLFGIGKAGTIYAYLAAANSAVSKAFLADVAEGAFTKSGVFWQRRIDVADDGDARAELLARLRTIRNNGWHWSRRLRRGEVVAYQAPNGGGYTLEALFDINPNGDATPDFKGWELKACGSDRVTLMTPEPNGGYYGEHGAEAFLRRYGREVADGESLYFTGIHRVAEECKPSGQTLSLRGFQTGGKTFDALGYVELLDAKGAVSASWSFAKLLEHWGRKHAKAAYVPCDSRPGPPREYSYGSPVLLGEGTSFLKFLSALQCGAVYYDPAPKLERAATEHPRVHARSQFRVRLPQLPVLYDRWTPEHL